MPGSLFPVIKILTLGFASFVLAFLVTPILTHYLYKYKFWKQKTRDIDNNGKATPIVANLQSQQGSSGTPRMGGLLFWVVTIFVVAAVTILANLFPNLTKWDFLTRKETWLPLFTLIMAGFIGIADDVATVKGRGSYIAGGIAYRWRVFLIATLIGLVGAWWFVFKLGFDSIYIPGFGNIFLGWAYGLLFIVVLLAMFSSSIVDGIDGLSAGVFSTILVAYSAVAFARGQFDLATFCVVLLGALVAYLWFNIPPARFYMGETGILVLTTTVTVIAFLTNAVAILPIAGIILVIESGSVIVQLLSKKFRHGKKIFLSAPIHHHFEAKGWPAYKVTMRFWVISAVFSALALLLFLIGPR